jgi:hypothetical protein
MPALVVCRSWWYQLAKRAGARYLELPAIKPEVHIYFVEIVLPQGRVSGSARSHHRFALQQYQFAIKQMRRILLPSQNMFQRTYLLASLLLM